MSNPISAVADLGNNLLDKFFPDADSKTKSQLELLLTTFSAQAGIVQTEVASNSWLASNWRPITMLIFVGLIVLRWFGWSAPGLSEAEYLALWSIVKWGMSGYVVGRSFEKVSPSILSFFKK